MHPWIRLNRVIRDIPSQYILGGLNVPNMRQDVLSVMAKRGTRMHNIGCNNSNHRMVCKLIAIVCGAGLRCPCIRCREVGLDLHNAVARAVLIERQYKGSGADEHFLSFETEDTAHTICGFLRLRLPPSDMELLAAFPELQGESVSVPVPTH